MTTGTRMFIGIATVAVAIGAGAARAGSLTPPGAPGSTMKTLDQVEARTPIGLAGAQLTQPGSYYLTANLVQAGYVPAIEVQASDVTLDLNGFAILGSTGQGNGIYVNGGLRNVVIGNGTVRDCARDGILASSARCAFENLRILGNARELTDCAGIATTLETAAQIQRCTIEDNVGPGLVVGDGSSVRDCGVRNNGTHGIQSGGRCLLERNACVGNGAGGAGAGIYVTGGGGRIVGNVVVTNVTGLAIEGSGNHVADNTVRDNADNYAVAQGNQLNLLLCQIPETLDWPCSVKLAGTLVCAQTGTDGITVASDNVTIDLAGHTLVGPGASSGHGIYQSSVRRGLTVRDGAVTEWRGTSKGGVYANGRGVILDGVQATTNDYGLLAGSGGTLRGCTATGNGTYGLYAGSGSVLNGCASHRNSGCGIYAGNGCALADCAAQYNGGHGLYAYCGCVVERCAAQYNTADGFLLYEKNRVTGCLADGNGREGDGAGIRATGGGNRIAGNTVTGNDRGLHVPGVGNELADNTVHGNTDNYDLAADNRINLLLGEIPENLDWPCSVKLAGTLVCTQTGTDGITVASDNVTIDLVGHALVGPGESSGHGIYQASTHRNLTVRNGSVCGWRGTDAYGVSAGDSASLSGLSASTNFYGLYVCYGSVVSGCTATDNLDLGFCVRGGCTVRGCTALRNGGYGVLVGDGCVVVDCTATENRTGGITAIGANVIRSCCTHSNGHMGIWVGWGNRVSECQCSQNFGNMGSSGAGIFVYQDGNRIEGNTVTCNDVGVEVWISQNNLIIGNNASSNTVNWDIAAGNKVGPIVVPPDSGAILGDTGGAGVGSTDPWANFTH